VAGRLGKSSIGAAPRGKNADARDAHATKALRSAVGDSGDAPKSGRNRRGRAPVVHYPCLPSDQRELCIGIAYEMEACERWERIAAR